MASDEADLNISSVPGELICSICRNFLQEAVLLSCLHAFCSACIKQHGQGQGKNSCPACKESFGAPGDDVSRLPTSKFLDSFIKKRELLLGNMPCCDCCKAAGQSCKAEKKCLECPMWLCAECVVKTHSILPIFKSHDLIDVSEPISESSVREIFPPSASQCWQHPANQPSSVCVDCCLPICEQCPNSDHKGHRVESLPGAEDLSADLERLERDVRMTQRHLARTPSLLEAAQQHVTAAIGRMNAQGNQLIHLIKKLMKNKEKELKDSLREYQQELTAAMERVDEQRCRTQLQLARAHQAEEQGSQADRVLVERLLEGPRSTLEEPTLDVPEADVFVSLVGEVKNTHLDLMKSALTETRPPALKHELAGNTMYGRTDCVTTLSKPWLDGFRSHALDPVRHVRPGPVEFLSPAERRNYLTSSATYIRRLIQIFGTFPGQEPPRRPITTRFSGEIIVLQLLRSCKPPPDHDKKSVIWFAYLMSSPFSPGSRRFTEDGTELELKDSTGADKTVRQLVAEYGLRDFDRLIAISLKK